MKKSFPVFLSILALAVSAGAQAPDRNKSKAKGKALPIQGKQLPDVTAFDANGEEFPLAQKLKGQHGVIVFGCLT